jgi:dienelactone hydrolase
MTDKNMALDTPIRSTENPYPKPAYWIALIGLILIFSGAMLAHMIRTSDGISVSDIRFAGTDGIEMSALLYVPAGASEAAPAPAILAVHGYINSRETQDGFAIEFARRGYVVLSMDQTGHGYSEGPAFSNGFGGPDGLKYLRSLPMVDRDQIGLEGHSMGGWTVLAAAAAMPDAYQSIVLQGSSTGAPFAQEGNPDWPRNLALVFSLYDEFAQIMWGVDRAIDTPTSSKLQSVFGTQDKIVAGQLYGSLADGTARILHQPHTTHPGNHLSTDAIGRATDWFAKTLKGGSPRPASDQIWMWKEFGTGLGLLGFILLVIGTFDILIRLPAFAPLRRAPIANGIPRDRRWWTIFCFSTILPALIFFPVFIAAGLGLPASQWLPQAVTTQVTIWALASAGIALSLNRLFRSSATPALSPWIRTICIALATVTIAYLALLLVDRIFHTDLRFWVVAIKLPSHSQWGIAAIYVLPITAAFFVTLRSLCAALAVDGDSTAKQYGSAIATLCLGFVILLSLIYGIFFLTGTLITGFDPLSTVIALQFIPLLAAMAIITIFCWRRTGSHRPGATLAGILVTLYVVAGTATQI